MTTVHRPAPSMVPLWPGKTNADDDMPCKKFAKELDRNGCGSSMFLLMKKRSFSFFVAHVTCVRLCDIIC